MSVRILRDIEEAIDREVRRITFHDDRTIDFRVLKDTFDPITGENVVLPLEANYYDSSADTRQIQYPHIFVKLLKMKEDLTSGRVVPQYGNNISVAVSTAPRAFEQILYTSDGLISAPGNTIGTGIFKIKKVLPGYLLRVLSGNNIGTYKIATVVPSNLGNHVITVAPELVENLSALGFVESSRTVTFLTAVDLNTVKIGDVFTDSLNNDWNIIAVDPERSSIVIDGTSDPDLLEGGKISRVGDVFQQADLSLLKFSVMDPTKPITTSGGCAATSASTTVSPSIPIDLYYLVRIDSKERATHIDIANRMWEEFNPPRTALPTIVRSKLSADQKIIEDIASGGSNTVKVEDNSNYNIGDPVFVFDELTPTKKENGQGFQDVFTAQVISKTGTDTLVLSKTIPDTFLVENAARVVSNATYYLHMFHFMDHVTKDVEGAQYWSHEFTFWIQVFIDRQGTPVEQDGVIQKIEISGDDIDGNVIFEC
jgi:hypothetical protein